MIIPYPLVQHWVGDEGYWPHSLRHEKGVLFTLAVAGTLRLYLSRCESLDKSTARKGKFTEVIKTIGYLAIYLVSRTFIGGICASVLTAWVYNYIIRR
ncbi:hypothetical protein M430DRAFT_252406 [Amorphotheca resinae ATCC 22711]|jgi:hypothetical protein|uniref:Uncharacterized protein n=1 Tax=Amorphotheca resinae ATCC 22711 TaxID=857342 RepID=A0A2T3B116_AMORE|nr:hypothetical protein M430DRAFT_252406 [Amorphotheca resinae ATCC 22711]PSS17100.1 hypothetical protein M430DRAFT_252406 [Amorphotheca resinae ATCC 22711]